MSEDITAVDEVALRRTIGGFLGEYMENAFVLPLHVAVIAVNGSAVVFRYTAADGGGGLQTDVLAEYNDPNGMMVLPINIMIGDARGEAARVFIGPDGKSQAFN
jgi:hypothetical protein